MVFCEVVGCGCVGFGVVVWVRVDGILPRGVCDVVPDVAGVFIFEVCL